MVLLGIDLNGVYTYEHDNTLLFKILFVKPKIPVRQLQPDRHLQASVMPREQQLELYRLIQDLEMEADQERRKRKQGRMR